MADDDDRLSIRTRARLAGVSPATMLRRLRAEGDDQGGRTIGADGRNRPAHRGDTTDRDQRIRELRAEGDSLRTIAVRVGVSASTVHRVLGRPDQQPSG